MQHSNRSARNRLGVDQLDDVAVVRAVERAAEVTLAMPVSIVGRCVATAVHRAASR